MIVNGNDNFEEVFQSYIDNAINDMDIYVSRVVLLDTQVDSFQHSQDRSESDTPPT